MVQTVLLPSTGSSFTVRVNPVALFSICDAYIRRNEKQERVIGTLLGVIADNVIDVKSCYVVPHQESSETVGGNHVQACGLCCAPPADSIPFITPPPPPRA